MTRRPTSADSKTVRQFFTALLAWLLVLQSAAGTAFPRDTGSVAAEAEAALTRTVEQICATGGETDRTTPTHETCTHCAVCPTVLASACVAPSRDVDRVDPDPSAACRLGIDDDVIVDPPGRISSWSPRGPPLPSP
jgi:hypothetical protein